jgi:hypothetical protein
MNIKRWIWLWIVPNAAAVYTAFILQCFWNWFVVPATNLPPISFLVMYGLRLFTSMMFGNGGVVVQMMEFYWTGFLKIADRLTPELYRNDLADALNDFADGEFGWGAKKLLWQVFGNTVTFGVGWAIHMFIM